MSWTNQQKKLVHLYKRAAGLADQEYRAVLRDVSGCASAKHPGLTQYHFDVVMARIEARLDRAIAEGLVSPPAPGRISNLYYWRRRLAGPGDQNYRHVHLVTELWDLLTPHLPPSERTEAYLVGIASKACACRIASRWDLKSWQAGLLIDALRDRLNYAVRRGGAPASSRGTEAAVPVGGPRASEAGTDA